MGVMINPGYGWKTGEVPKGTYHYAGHELFLDGALSSLPCQQDMEKLLSACDGFFSGVLVLENRIVAWVDHIRSHPLYYAMEKGDLVLSNDARKVLSACSSPEQDEEALVDFTLSGFIGGPKTLYKQVKCLEPGCILSWTPGDEAPIIYRYFEYRPKPIEKTLDDNMLFLSNILDEITRMIIVRAAGRPIWIPLSAGLDSRIILCKLHQHGYQNIHTFTYGPSLNFEAIHANKIAKKLNVPWRFVKTSPGFCRRLFLSKMRKDFASFADGVKAVPCMREFAALASLKGTGALPDDAIIINGQSGDYISGGHVDEFWYRTNAASEDDFMRVLMAKHYDLWSLLKQRKNVVVARENIRKLLPAYSQTMSPMEWGALGERWEYDARQIAYVVNGQRAYEFFGHEWELPLWEKKLVNFFESVPYAQKRGQALFKAYLKSYNYKGLFPEKEPHIWRWPILMLWVLPVGKLIELLISKTRKNEFYAFMRYCGHYANQYSFFPFALHARTYKVARNVVSLFMRQWFVDNPDYILPTDFRDSLKIGDKGPFKL